MVTNNNRTKPLLLNLDNNNKIKRIYFVIFWYFNLFLSFNLICIFAKLNWLIWCYHCTLLCIIIFTTSKLPLNLHPLYRISHLNLVVTKINQVEIAEIVLELNAQEIMVQTTIHGNAVDVSETKQLMIRISW